MKTKILYFILIAFCFGCFSQVFSMEKGSGETSPFKYTVKTYDTLRDLAFKFYGFSESWKLIFDANQPLISNPDVIEEGWELTIPKGKKWNSWNIKGLNFHPYGYSLNDDEYTGYHAELIKQALRSMQIVPSVSSMGWEDVIKNLKTGSIDLAFPAIGDRERFKNNILVKLCDIEIVFVSIKKFNFDYAKLSDLASYRIGQIDGYSYCTSYNETDLNKISYHTSSELMGALFAGDVDLIIGDRVTLSYFAKEKGVYEKLKFHDPIDTVPTYVMFPKNNLAQAKKLQKGLTTIRENGVFEQIKSTWN